MGSVRHELLLQAKGLRDGPDHPVRKQEGKAQKQQPDDRAGQTPIA